MEDLAGQRGVTVDRAAYERAMEGQREKARKGSTFKTRTADIPWRWQGDLDKQLERIGDQFEGYTATRSDDVSIVALFDEGGEAVEGLTTGSRGYVALAKTPFYVEAGGQVSDAGRLVAPGVEARVDGLIRVGRWPRLHLVEVTAGALSTGAKVTADVVGEVRDATLRNHTATHLLHAALRQVLGAHVKQAGSLVAPDRLRFDFVHFAAVAREQLETIERIVNDQIVRNTAVRTDISTPDDAIAKGAMALFGEKYGDRVRVVSVPGFSMELCGGTHVRATGDIGPFVITEESGVAAGVRRIEALTGAGAVRWMQGQRASLHSVLGVLSTTAPHAVESVQRLQADVKRLAREIDQLKMKAALGGGGSDAAAIDRPVDVGGVKLITKRVAGIDKGGLRAISDTLRDRLGSGVVVIASEHDGKVGLVVAVTKDLVGRIQAGRLVKELAPIVGGGGGGRPDFAEAGGKDPSRIDDLLAKAPDALRGLL
jgi:alanyl-tRNA synthetase